MTASLLTRSARIRTRGLGLDLEHWTAPLRPRSVTRAIAFLGNLGSPEGWHRQAACRGAETAIFYGSDDAASVLNTHELAAARAICAGCTVRTMCLDSALRQDDRYGVRAGATGNQRRELRRKVRSGTSVEEVVREFLATQDAGQGAADRPTPAG